MVSAPFLLVRSKAKTCCQQALTVNRTANGIMTSDTFTLILRNRLALVIIFLIRQILLKSAEKVIVKPNEDSHGNAIQAAEHAYTLATLSSMLSGMMDDAMIRVPMQIIARNDG